MIAANVVAAFFTSATTMPTCVIAWEPKAAVLAMTGGDLAGARAVVPGDDGCTWFSSKVKPTCGSIATYANPALESELPAVCLPPRSTRYCTACGTLGTENAICCRLAPYASR